MKKLALIIVTIVTVSCSGTAQESHKKTQKIYPVTKTDAQWKEELTTLQYYVLRESGTERPFSSPLNDYKQKGIYTCAACKTPLYESDYKFNSGTGWPSFDRAIIRNVELDVDYKIGYARTELKCATCGGHLGHSFNDGPSNTTGQRHCINGAALLFKKEL